MIDITYLYCRLSLYEEIFQSVDALLESVHGDLTAAAVSESLRELRHVLVQLVPAHTQRLCLGLSVGQALPDLVVFLQGDVQSRLF